jgi:CheY-like chemotaxis protein
MKASVLVIDDDVMVQQLMKAFLVKEGYEVTVAAGGKEGLELAREVAPDVITLDIAMPGLDGWHVLSALKADPNLAEIPVIMLTMVDDKSLGYALGAAEYMHKPIDRDRLLRLLRKYDRRNLHTALVVDDDADTRNMVRQTIEKDGWKVETAENGRIALEAVNRAMPGVILLDLMMPEMDGFAFVEEFRRLPNTRGVPIIVMTAKDLSVEDKRRLEGSVQRILQKGSSTESLLSELRELVAESVRRVRVQPV